MDWLSLSAQTEPERESALATDTGGFHPTVQHSRSALRVIPLIPQRLTESCKLTVLEALLHE
jgi:hypothetical protein